MMKTKSILVVEDNKLNMKLVRSILQMGQYHVIEAVDAETGIRLAREKKPDLILMDIQLPDLDGFTATRLIHQDKDLKSIPIIALTSFAMQSDEQKAAEAGCNGYISKPIDTREFLNQLKQWLI